MGLLNREQIKAIQDAVFEEVPVPEWGGTVRVKAISGMERDSFEASFTDKKARLQVKNVRARLVRLACVDQDGKALFQPSDETWLGEKSAAALDRVFEVAMRLAGMRTGDIEEAQENFTSDQSDGSISV